MRAANRLSQSELANGDPMHVSRPPLGILIFHDFPVRQLTPTEAEGLATGSRYMWLGDDLPCSLAQSFDLTWREGLYWLLTRRDTDAALPAHPDCSIRGRP